MKKKKITTNKKKENIFATGSGTSTGCHICMIVCVSVVRDCTGRQCERELMFAYDYTCAAYINCTHDREFAHSNIHLLKSQIETSVDGLEDRLLACALLACALLAKRECARMKKDYQRLV